MDLKGAEIRNISDLCSDMNSKEKRPMRVIIPFYQRPYKWGQEHIQRLVDDFFKNNCNEYFVGSVVMITPDERAGETHYSVIDGQQRITTLFLAEYLRFQLLRSYIETLISIRRTTKIDTLLSDLESITTNLFGDNVRQAIENAHEVIVDKLDKENDDKKDDDFYNELLKTYQDATYLPERDFSDFTSYEKKCNVLLMKLLSSSSLSLIYKRDSYNKKLSAALSSVAVKVTDTEKPTINDLYDTDDTLIAQYVNAITYIFEGLCNRIPYRSGQEKPLEYVYKLISSLEGIVNNIKLCVIITGNEKDAYTLFEVLNDRALEIDDLDLIKNLFYKWYCTKSNESDAEIDSYIEKADRMWVEDVFYPGIGVDRTKLISFLAAEYLTADSTLKYADKEKYRETLESSYLEKHPNYNKTNITNDIYIYRMVAMIISKFDLRFTKKNERVILAEESDKSITYKALHLLNALKQYGVIPAVTNAVIKAFVTTHMDDDGLIKINEFESFLDGIINDKNHESDDYKYIHNTSYVFWRLALLCNNAEIPREEAKKAISKVNALNDSFDYVLDATREQELFNSFTNWIDSWKYGEGDDALRAKVLFINLFKTSKESNDKLKILATTIQFNTSKLHLDHLEAQKTTGASDGLYFSPKDSGVRREDYVNSLGNMMILDQDDNNDKSNLPLHQALHYYDNMCADHWLINEIKELIQTNSECFEDHNGIHVPNEKFFSERRNRLTKYFKALLRRGLRSNEMQL